MKLTIVFFTVSLFILNIEANNSKKSEYRNILVEKSDDYLKGNIYQKDYLLFIDMLKTTHPAFCNKEYYPTDLENISKMNYKLLNSCNSVDKLWLFLQSTVTPLNDAHTYVSDDIRNENIYLINIYFDNEKFYITAIDKANISILGEEVESLNDIPVSEIVEKFSKIISSDNQIGLKGSISKYLVRPDFLQYLSCANFDTTLHVKCKNGKQEILKLKIAQKSSFAVVKIEKPQHKHTQYNGSFFSYQIIDDICYFQFNKCIDYNTLKCQIYLENNSLKRIFLKKKVEKELLKYPRFDTFLDSMFTDINSKNIRTLVVDVRYNGGGNSGLCNQLLSYLYPYDSLKEFSISVRMSEFMRQHYPKLFEDYKIALNKSNNKLIIGNMYKTDSLLLDNKLLDKVFLINKNPLKIFKGETVFIQGESAASSAGMLLTIAADNNIGRNYRREEYL